MTLLLADRNFAKFLIREFTNKDSNSVFNLILNIVDKEFNLKVDLNGLDSDLVCLENTTIEIMVVVCMWQKSKMVIR